MQVQRVCIIQEIGTHNSLHQKGPFPKWAVSKKCHSNKSHSQKNNTSLIF